MPTFVFIVLMSLLQYLIYNSVGRNDLFTFKSFLNSILLCENSVGYVWTMKVYFMNFVLIQLLGPILKKLNNVRHYLLLISMFLLLYFWCLYIYYDNFSHSYLS